MLYPGAPNVPSPELGLLTPCARKRKFKVNMVLVVVMVRRLCGLCYVAKRERSSRGSNVSELGRYRTVAAAAIDRLAKVVANRWACERIAALEQLSLAAIEIDVGTPLKRSILGVPNSVVDGPRSVVGVARCGSGTGLCSGALSFLGRPLCMNPGGFRLDR